MPAPPTYAAPGRRAKVRLDTTAAIVAWLILAFIAGLSVARLLSSAGLRSRTASEYQLAMIAAALPLYAWEHDVESGRIDWLNDATALFGKPIPNFTTLQSLVAPEDLPRLAALAKGQTPAPREGIELRVARANAAPGDESRWLRCHWCAIPSKDGVVRRVTGVCIDVDAQRGASDELLKQHAEYQIMFDSSPALIWFKDRQNRILRINATAAAAIGKSIVDIEGHATADVYPDEADKYYSDDLEVIESGRPKLGIIDRLTASDGTKRWVRADKIPYRDHTGKVIGVIVFALDITDMRRADEQLSEALAAAERASEAKSEFLSAMSHEIRTPLGVITGFAELQGTPNLELATRLAYSDKILRNARRLMKLIDEILDLSKVERGQLQLEDVEVSLAALIADVASLLSQKARAKGIAFAIHTRSVDEHGDESSELASRIVSDPSRLRQVLINVVDNAIKFTERGGVRVDVVATRLATPPGVTPALRLEVTVADTGIGMTSETTARLFQPFAQGDASTARKFGGSGLGLSLSRRLAQALGGDLELVETVPGRGSTFRITLEPALASTEAMPAVSYQRVDAMSGDLSSREQWSGVKVVLVEDNPDIQDMIRMFLEDTGATLIVAGNGIDGMAAARDAFPPAIVLMDLQLPGVDGMRATAELRASGFRHPIIAMTAHAMKGQRQLCLDAGFDDFLTKPLSRDDLLHKLSTWATKRP